MNDFTRAIDFIGSHQPLLWEKTAAHMELSGVALGIAAVLALSLGLWLGHLRQWSFLAINLANVGRALPSLALISIGLGVLGIGFWNVTVALVVLAAPIMLTNAYVAVEQVDREVVDAATGMGMSGWQVFRRAQLPLAIPLLFTGIRTATLYVIATATLAAVAGGGGLGDIIANQGSYRFEGVLGAAIWVAGLALVADLALAQLQRMLTPQALRLTAPPTKLPAGPQADLRARTANLSTPSRLR